MKNYFVFFLSMILLSCSDTREDPRGVSELSHEQKISQVQKLFMPEGNEVFSTGIENTKSETGILHTEGGEYVSGSTQKLIENTSEKPSIYEKEFFYGKDVEQKMEYASRKEIFTPEEIDLIESTTDAEIDKLIDIIFKE